MVARRPLGLALAPLLAPGVWSVVHAFRAPLLRGGSAKRYIALGMLGIVVAIAGAYAALWPPRRVEVTAGGVRWGGRPVGLAEIAQLRATTALVRSRAGAHTHWRLTLATTDGRERAVRLTHNRGGEPPGLRELVAAVERVLEAGRRRAAGGR